MFEFTLTVMGYIGLALLISALAGITIGSVLRWRREEDVREQEKLEAAFQKARLRTWNE